MKAILVRVGIDSSAGNWLAPVDPKTQDFVYVPIPELHACNPDLARGYTEIVPALRGFCKVRDIELDRDLRFPAELLDCQMHLDPDFANLTYGDYGPRRGRGIGELSPGDLLLFYASLRPVTPCEHRCVYALIGKYEVETVTAVPDIPRAQWADNAHTRKLDHCPDDIVVRARAGVSGRFDKCIPIGEFRDGAYRVREDLLEEWGGLSVKNGHLQRSAVPPSFVDPTRVLRWLDTRGVKLLQGNN